MSGIFPKSLTGTRLNLMSASTNLEATLQRAIYGYGKITALPLGLQYR